jgi:hypothetical protein
VRRFKGGVVGGNGMSEPIDERHDSGVYGRYPNLPYNSGGAADYHHRTGYEMTGYRSQGF